MNDLLQLLPEKDTQAVFKILTDQLGVQESQLTPDARLHEDLGADSLDVVEITINSEEYFDITVPDEMAERVSTVGDLFQVLVEVVGKREQRARGGK